MNGINLAPGLSIPAHLANRHGLISGQTGTGKSVTLMRLAEQFSRAGTSVFLSDVKGDLGIMSRTSPVSFLCPYGTTGEPFAASVQDLGPDLLARALDLSDAQSGTLELAFHFAASIGTPIHTKNDLKLLLAIMLKNRAQLAEMGQVSPASVGVIQRALLRLDDGVLSAQSFDVARLIVPGQISILRSNRIMTDSPRLYAALLMRTLIDLDRRLPEVGDLPNARLAFFFDEAHLLFKDSPVALVNRIERTIRLIRSKGVGVYFASQSPNDLPDTIRAQCAHRIEHDRAHGVGRANVSTLKLDGTPLAPRVVRITAPACLTAPATADETAEPIYLRPRADAPATGQRREADDASGVVASVAIAGIFLACVAYTILSVIGVPFMVAACMGAGAFIGSMVTLRPHKRHRH